MGISCSPIALLIDLKEADKWHKLLRTLFATVETLSSQKEQPDGGPEKERSVPVEPGLWLFRFSRLATLPVGVGALLYMGANILIPAWWFIKGRRHYRSKAVLRD
jgi:hypothetical protein